MVNLDETRRWAVRLAAPLAFFLGATILIVLVQSGLNGSESATTPATTTALTTGTQGTTTSGAPRRYRVRRGDTLESIAAKFDTTVDQLLELNPDIDPLALSPGDRIRVR